VRWYFSTESDHD